MKHTRFPARLLSILLTLCLAGILVPAQANEPVNTEGIEIPVISGIKAFEVPENEAMAFLRHMKLGWNLGNTFDAWPNIGGPCSSANWRNSAG